MNTDLLKNVIFDQHETIRNAAITERDYSFEPNANYVLTGLRRAGKSTLLYKMARDIAQSGISWERIIYINFEDERLSGMASADLNSIVKAQAELSTQKGYYFFDEIQNIPGWENFARRMADSKEYVQITGSNAKMLSGEIETVLGGRYLSKHIMPYSFAEYLRASGIEEFSSSKNNGQNIKNALMNTKKSGRIMGIFAGYFKYGGFPQSLEFKDKREYVSSVYQKVLLGDIAGRNGIRNYSALMLLMKKIAESTKDEMSYSKMHNVLSGIGTGISKSTVIDYLRYAQEAYIIFAVRNYYAKFSERESVCKYYFSDNGLLNLFLNGRETLLLENLAAISLYRKYGRDFYYIKSSKTGLDIDFYIPGSGTLVQAAYSLDNISSERELKSLAKAAKAMPEAKNFIIITYYEEKTIYYGGIEIKAMPIWKMLAGAYTGIGS